LQRKTVILSKNISKFAFYKQCIKVLLSLNLKCIKFIQILLEKYFWKLKGDAQLFLLQPAQPAHSPRGGPAATAARARARGLLRPGPPSLAHGRAGARASGRENLGPGRAFPSPPGPKEAHTRAGRCLPLDRDQRTRVVFGGSKTHGAAPPPKP
jgi:hypothetical protein